ncbi:hypothetical protein [Streptomyces mangrovisoli]|uniref:Uncharacterized protein n=1 Tax=Streptomyces mangrovisoli TaxID=1428628 RepID=A0A1J4NMJ9_9ACTN|nr:hypothetical protein [Streptomyces mangrovisoli]OIJ63559.1 hypothetical protein WN71_032525 [Streptomyces mangrovisoli]
MSNSRPAQIEAVLDLREWSVPLNGPDDLRALWAALEPQFHGVPLAGHRSHTWRAAAGAITLEVVRADPAVLAAGPDTTVSLVAIREAPWHGRTCRACESGGESGVGQGVHRCDTCANLGLDADVCAAHAVLVEGTFAVSCPEHRPSCREEGCGSAATFWCSGSRCRSRTAWCDTHRVRHPQDPDTAYCPACYRLAFPVCEHPGCAAAGTVTCDWHDQSGRPCDAQACTRHARRWQVFGPKEIGLGLCRTHDAVQGRAPMELLHQICVGAARKRHGRMPSLQAFAHTLRNCGHRALAVDYPGIRSVLDAVRTRADASGVRGLGPGMDKAASGWHKELSRLHGNSVAGAELLDRLKRLVLLGDQRFGGQIAAELRLEEYKPAFTAGGKAHPGRLWVLLPQDLRGLFSGKARARAIAYERELGVEIKLADNNTGKGRR